VPRAIAAALLLVCRIPVSACAEPAQAALPAEGRGLPFWTALAKDCAVPAGESAAGLVSEAVSLLGSPDTR
jgi:hypothetical protein